jgi:hypothetical protein
MGQEEIRNTYKIFGSEISRKRDYFIDLGVKGKN